MPRAIDRRLAAAEEAAKSKAPKLLVITARGGLPGPIRCTTVDGVHWQRLPDEPMEVFKKRIIAAAESAKSETVIFGGLCACAWREPGAFERYLKGPDFRLFDGDGIAIE